MQEGWARDSLFCSNIAPGIRRWPASLWLWSSFGDIDDLQGPFSRTSLRFLSHVFGENYEIVTLAKHYTCVVVVLLNNSFYGSMRPALCTPSSLPIVTHFHLHFGDVWVYRKKVEGRIPRFWKRHLFVEVQYFEHGLQAGCHFFVEKFLQNVHYFMPSVTEK